MRILEREEDELKVVVERPEDLYYLALLLEPGDLVYSWTTRQIKVERRSGKSVRGERVRVYLGIEIKGISYHRFTKKLRIKGVVVEAPERFHAKGSFHTLSLGPGSEVRIIKVKGIRSFHEDILRRALKASERILIASIGDEEAAIGVLSRPGIRIVARIPAPPRSGKVSSLYEIYGDYVRRALEECFRIYEVEGCQRLLILYPSVFEAIIEEALRKKPRNVSLVRVRVSEGGLSGIYEAMRSAAVREMIARARLEFEAEEVEEVLKALAKDSRYVALGLKEVKRAVALRAVKKLLIVDELFFEEKARSELEGILEALLECGGELAIISSETEQGSIIKRLGGVVALLYYPLELAQ